MDLRLDLRLSQKLVMTPQLQQAIKLLQLSRLELQQALAQHLVENPLLEDLALETQDEEPR
jgi:RNA polymerase sigma-54 factor